VAQFIYLVLFSYAFLQGIHRLAITIARPHAIPAMQLTGGSAGASVRAQK